MHDLVLPTALKTCRHCTYGPVLSHSKLAVTTLLGHTPTALRQASEMQKRLQETQSALLTEPLLQSSW